MAVAEVVLEVLPQPPPPPREPAAALRKVAVPKLVPYLCLALASAWVGCASTAAATVARRALGEDSPVTYAFLKVLIGSFAFSTLVIVVVILWILRFMCAMGFRSLLRIAAKDIQSQIQSKKRPCQMFGGLIWKMLWNPAVLVWLLYFVFLLLTGAGLLVFEGLLPVEESQREKIAYALSDTRVLGAMAMFCFVIIPSLALKIWRSK
ncbi:unnamed protein product [Urochloa decumbens]|uniref:Uncharacterized protein n=1 Tax=Urochloa decumbens TaxID=240449 RepID=A0ABC9BQW8_9POAL